MEIIDKTNETWKIGDIVIDNDERKGIIKKTKDDDFVIVRIDEKHVGDYFCGLAYEAGINMYCLQRKASEFHKVNDNNGNEQWQLGDVVTDGINYGLVITDDCSDYMVLNFKGNNQYTTDQTSSYDSIEELQDYYPTWHKVNAKLVIE